MNRSVLIGLILIALGILGLVVPRITYQEEAGSISVGPLDVEVQRERSIEIPDVLAGVAIVAGGVLVAMGARGNSSG